MLEYVETLVSNNLEIYQQTILEKFGINHVSPEVRTTQLMISPATDSPPAAVSDQCCKT